MKLLADEELQITDTMLRSSTATFVRDIGPKLGGGVHSRCPPTCFPRLAPIVSFGPVCAGDSDPSIVMCCAAA
jgi:hypothetical protein